MLSGVSDLLGCCAGDTTMYILYRPCSTEVSDLCMYFVCGKDTPLLLLVTRSPTILQVGAPSPMTVTMTRSPTILLLCSLELHLFCINKYNRNKNWRLWGTIQILPFHSLGNHQKTLYFEQTNKMTMIMTMTMTSISSAAKTRGFFWVSEQPQGTNCVAFRDGRRSSISHLSSIWSEINWTFIRLIELDWLKWIELD